MRVGERVDVLRHATNWKGEYVELAELGTGEFLLWMQPVDGRAKQCAIYGREREADARQHFANLLGWWA